MQISKIISSNHMNLGLACWVLITYQKRALYISPSTTKILDRRRQVIPTMSNFFLSIRQVRMKYSFNQNCIQQRYAYDEIFILATYLE